MKNQRLVLIISNVRSAHNVGSMFRSADGFGAKKVFLTGYTPYPMALNDNRLPHIAQKAEKRISKTALGAEKALAWEHVRDAQKVILRLKEEGYKIIALEQTPFSTPLPQLSPYQDVALIVGNEIDGLDKKLLAVADACVEIPMDGKKESFNVAIAAAIAMYHLRYS